MADQQLAEAEARRNADSVLQSGSRGQSKSPTARSRSRSVDSSSSVSTISTNKSRSRSRSHSRDRGNQLLTSGRASRTRLRTPTIDMPHKRKHHSVSSSNSRSSRSPRRAAGSHRKSRRHRTISPIDRGRPSSMRRGSHRSRSNSLSMDKSQITKHRRSLDSENGSVNGEARESFGIGSSGHRSREVRRERSLSPYSKRLALTQAMNM